MLNSFEESRLTLDFVLGGHDVNKKNFICQFSSMPKKKKWEKRRDFVTLGLLSSSGFDFRNFGSLRKNEKFKRALSLSSNTRLTVVTRVLILISMLSRDFKI